jgi:hypothetical protein
VGCARIHGELLKLGIAVAQSTVARYLPRPRKPPSQTWRTFLTNHLAQTAAVDFLTVPTATFRVLFVFVVLAHERRRVVHFGVAEHPTQEWTMQQMREAFPWDQAPRYVLRDRDAILRKRPRRHDPRYGNGGSAYCAAIPSDAPLSRSKAVASTFGFLERKCRFSLIYPTKLLLIQNRILSRHELPALGCPRRLGEEQRLPVFN